MNKKAFLTKQVSAIIECKTPVKYKDLGCPTISINIGGTCVEKTLLGSYCEPAAIFHVQAAWFGIIEAHFHHTISSR